MKTKTGATRLVAQKTHYDHAAIEEQWQKQWEEARLDETDISHAKRPFYNLMMFPYPSAEGLHVGNMYAFTGSDIYGRFKRMQGWDVFEPIGLDGFGIHSENYALKIGRHPMDHAAVTQKNFYRQLGQIGCMYDWSRTIETYDPSYYRWTQWLFIQMYKHGLAYRGKAEVNFCPSCKTVLADEQVVKKGDVGKTHHDLDNSDVVTGKVSVCERCGNTVIKKLLEQWFFRITAYAEKLLENLSSLQTGPSGRGLDWPEKVRIAQQRWIGKKEGINIVYDVKDSKEKITCFTTTPVNFAATFIVLSPEHPVVLKVTKPALLNDIMKYIDVAKKKTPQERVAEGREKTGMFTGSYCINHVTGEAIPIWVSDFVIMNVGTGAIQGCPGHDIRDFEFAIKYHLPIKRVVVGSDGDTSPIDRAEQVIQAGQEGIMVNSEFLNGMTYADAMEKTKDYFEQKGWGKRVVTYHLRDWLISRQRYWGPPIPMVYCSSCAQKDQSWFTTKEAQSASGNPKSQIPMTKQAQNPKSKTSLGFGAWDLELPTRSAGWYPVPEKDLPVMLPRIDDYKPGDDGIAPLAKHKEFFETTCPGCGGKAVRETDVSDTFLDSSWYFLRYPSVNVGNPKSQFPNPKQIQNPKSKSLEIGNLTLDIPWDREVTRRWLPVHMYTGGAEHSVLHLMYSRFVWMALRDWGYLDFSGEAGSRLAKQDPASQDFAGDEPFTTFYAHGLVIKDGAKMSKSKGNVVNPDDYIARYGTDALRLYLMFTGPYDQGGDFRDSAMEGMHRWVGKVWRMAQKSITQHSSTSSATVKKALHRAIKKIGEDIERRRYNTAIAAMMELVNIVNDQGGAMGVGELKDFLLILAPFAPYLTEELWQQIGYLEDGRWKMDDEHGSLDDLKYQGVKKSTIQDPSSRKSNFKDPDSRSASQYTFTKSKSIHYQPWPVYDPKLLEEDTVEIVIQFNGKLRDTIEVESVKGKVQSEVEALAKASEKVQKYLEGKTVQKVIFVPGKLLNFVV